MKMKLSVIFLFAVVAGAAYGQAGDENRVCIGPNALENCGGSTTGAGGGSQQRQAYNSYTLCQQELSPLQTAAIATGATPDAIARFNQKKVECRTYEIAAQAAGGGNASLTDSMRTTDGRITCVQKAGYTFDYASCKSAATMYNWINVLESGMLQTQNMRLQNNQANITADTATRAAQGDAQNAALDATVAVNNYKSSLSLEQAAAYSSAVAALSAKITSWQKKDQASLETLCSQTVQASDLVATQIPSTVPPVSVGCRAAIAKALTTGAEAFANENAKSQFIAAAFTFANKAAAAMFAAKQQKAMANAVQKAADGTTTPTTPVLARCVVTPLDPACVVPTTRTEGTVYTPGDFNAGEGFGSNSFTNGTTDENFGEMGDPTNVPDGTTVAGVTSPFESDAKIANGILKPAAAATTTPTGGSGGGGGGAGGGLGGGGVSLGSDLDGAEKDDGKASEIKANSAAGAYGATGGKGFSALAAGKQDANPFASMFGKSEGGVEEDRSIASGDIDGKASGLFQKISHRYELIQADKRVEAANVDK